MGKRIGIINYHRSYNYGAFLQCYSLKERIKNDYPDCQVEVIDYVHKSVIDKYRKSADYYDNNEVKKQITIRNQRFEESLAYLDLSPEHFISDDSSELFEYMNARYDIIIVGSDAVWNWESRGLPNAYFLKGFKGHKLSYAASAHLLHFENVTDEQRSFLRDAWDEFDYIGVRDDETERFIHSVCSGYEVYHNCDPTTFLDIKSIPVSIIEIENKIQKVGADPKGNLIGLMAYPYSLGAELCKQYGRNKIISLYEPNQYGLYLYDLSPLEFAVVFLFFEATITHYFHGTMLSLRNLVPAFTIESTSLYSKNHKTKIHDLMEKLCLEDYYYCTNYNKAIRGLRKFGLFYDSRLWRDVYKKISLIEDNKEQISRLINERLECEASSYDSFKKTLDSLLI